MRQGEVSEGSWRKMVLTSMPRPAWLSEDAPHADVVLSSRTRVMRNLSGCRFPNRADDQELERVMRSILAAAKDAQLPVEVYRALATVERDHLVACRLVSPDFPWTLPNRAVLVDVDRSLSLMVNEEDHLRVQALSAGWSIDAADSQAKACCQALAARLRFAEHPSLGYLSASPFNCGAGRRRSAMFHLIGLAQGNRLPQVMQALGTEGLAVRGLFGEASRALGAFVQISATQGDRTSFVGACEYLLREERSARTTIGRDLLADRAVQARDFAVRSASLSLADALRVLGWIRWAAIAEIPGFAFSHRDADAVLANLDLRGVGTEPEARRRANAIRELVRA